ncbi:MAG: hypothetical protein NTV66_08540 [Methylococcales bacterium]|jgi:hypothetical protein|nr:hypothetical protein [Methylococcales bacterium]
MNLFYGHNLISSAYTKLFIQLSIIGILIVFYDVMLHTLFLVVHIAFEWLEFLLDRVIEHLFDTNRQQSQIIVFYLLWLIGFYGIYRVLMVFSVWFGRLKKKISSAFYAFKLFIVAFWDKLSLIEKAKWVVAFTVSILCLFILGFM